MGNLRPVLIIGLLFLGYMIWVQWQKDYGPAPQPRGIEYAFDPLFEGIPAMETPAEAEIVRLAGQLTGHAPEAVAFGTEAPYLGRLGMQTVVLGPGDIDQAHQPDEYIRLDRLDPTIDLLQTFIKRICVRD